MDTDGDGTVTREVRYLNQILNSRCPIHILFRSKLIHLKTINLNFKLKSIYQIAEKIDIIFFPLMSVRKERTLEVRENEKRLLRSSSTAKSCSLNNSQKCLRFFAIFRSSSASAKICQKNKSQRHLTSTTQVGTTSKHIYGKLKNDEKVKSQCQLYAYLTSTTQMGTTSMHIDNWKVKKR